MTNKDPSRPWPSHEQRFRLDGRTIFLSGAAGHLGRAMALGFGQAGGHVILNGRTAARLEAFAEELRALDISCSVSAFDVMDRARAAEALGGLGRLDVLVNNAITGLPNRDEATGAEGFRVALESGIVAAYENVRAALPALETAAAATGHASVINVTSIWGHVSPVLALYGDTGLASPPQYGAAKGGLLQLTRYLACELAPKGVRVNSLSPGIFPWPEIVRDKPDFVAGVSARAPMARTGRAEEIAGPAVFLACDASSYMTGADLLIDGGWTAW